jgi:starvation-inducible DNA-binding protein
MMKTCHFYYFSERVIRMNLSGMMNRQIANWTVLYVKLHNFHWYVTGESFYTLHAKFEELYNEAAAHIDELAERLLAIGGKPVAALSESLKLATIREAEGEKSAREMVQTLVDDFSQLIRELKEGTALAESEGDEATADLLLAMRTGLEKQVWMLKAFLA